ncbi:hypothetical protein EJB05_00761 [Eragrostis curvula]|uniref:F-box domain-containing protein n=1 Tax=Eragrostis curvula TaxID=38414 RepID=A0A5J9WMJ7_9POAL|nr:hypothetical protein EJB05_00761 [Eragrostis curvula]
MDAAAADPPPAKAPSPATPSSRVRAMDLNIDALELVFKRVDSPVSLIRAAAVCKRWRHAIADPAFLRLFRSLHPPVAAGSYNNAEQTDGRIRPVFVPASPSVDARHFSLDFLPGGGSESWAILDSRGSLLLMCRGNPYQRVSDMFVCEPLTRKCRRIDFNSKRWVWGSYLIDGDGDEAGSHIGISNFRVICLNLFESDNDIFSIFNEAGGAGSSWSHRSTGGLKSKLVRGSLGVTMDSLYFMSKDWKLATLNKSSGEFSTSLMPPIEEVMRQYALLRAPEVCAVINGRDGKLRVFFIFPDNSVKVFVRLDAGDWTLESSVLLSEAARGLPGYNPSYFERPKQTIITKRRPGFVILMPRCRGLWSFSIDLETMEVALALPGIGSPMPFLVCVKAGIPSRQPLVLNLATCPSTGSGTEVAMAGHAG